MMEAQVVLCADSESIQNPGLVGLEGERLEAQSWLRVFCSAVEARAYLQTSPSVSEVWVASSDEVDPINLAAALKKDSLSKAVSLLAFRGTGSLKSRACAAGLDETLSQEDFARRYGQAKLEHQESMRESYAKKPELATQQNTIDSASEHDKLPSPAGIYQRPVQGEAGENRAAHIISIVSATGGSGKSTVAALTALFAQGLGHQTLLLDADLQFGDMRYMLGEENPLTIDALLEDFQKVSRLKPDGMCPALLAAPPQLEQSETIAKQVPVLLESLKTLFDVIVVNTGAFWSEQHAALLERSSTALFLVDQRASSLKACKHALDLCLRCGIATHPFVFAVNRCTRNSPLSSIDVACALQGARTLELQEGGREVGELLEAGIPFELIKARNTLCLSIERMVIDLLPQVKRTTRSGEKLTKSKGFWGNRKRRKVACL